MLKNGCCGTIMSNMVKFATVTRYMQIRVKNYFEVKKSWSAFENDFITFHWLKTIQNNVEQSLKKLLLINSK